MLRLHDISCRNKPGSANNKQTIVFSLHNPVGGIISLQENSERHLVKNLFALKMFCCSKFRFTGLFGIFDLFIYLSDSFKVNENDFLLYIYQTLEV